MEGHYYSAEGGGDYKAFLEHFKKQAEGLDRPVVFNTKNNFTTYGYSRAGRSHLILVNTKSKPSEQDKVHRLEIVDPNESERRRAVAEIVREEAEVTKGVEKLEKPHSRVGAHKRRTNTHHNNNTAIASVKSKIRRVKDVFDD